MVLVIYIGLLIGLAIVYGIVSGFVSSRKCYPHRVFGRCRRCEEEAIERAEEEAEAIARVERQQREIELAFKEIDAAKRHELIALVKERAHREDLYIGPGDLERAVVRMYKKSLRTL